MESWRVGDGEGERWRDGGEEMERWRGLEGSCKQKTESGHLPSHQYSSRFHQCWKRLHTAEIKKS